MFDDGIDKKTHISHLKAFLLILNTTCENELDFLL